MGNRKVNSLRPTPRRCVVCRCTDSRACPGGCTWVADQPWICSRCGRLWQLVLACVRTADPELNVAKAIATDILCRPRVRRVIRAILAEGLERDQ